MKVVLDRSVGFISVFCLIFRSLASPAPFPAPKIVLPHLSGTIADVSGRRTSRTFFDVTSDFVGTHVSGTLSCNAGVDSRCFAISRIINIIIFGHINKGLCRCQHCVTKRILKTHLYYRSARASNVCRIKDYDFLRGAFTGDRRLFSIIAI